MILLIDNYDSFTYNLYQYLLELGADVEVARNDKITVDEIRDRKPDKIVVSPGPKTPVQAGISSSVIQTFGMTTPILGVCLGHQCIGHAFGANIRSATEIMHGKISLIHHDGLGLYKDLPNPFEAIRYHSLAVEVDKLPNVLEVSAWTEDGTIMGLRHKTLPVEGIQFHPESIMTKVGHDLLRNFLKY